MHLVCSKCGATCMLEEPARGKKARTFAGCATCGHLNRVPRGNKASRERDDASERTLAVAANAARALGGGSTRVKSTLLGVGARVSATDLLSRATPTPPMVSPTPPPSRARISVPPPAEEGEIEERSSDTMRAPVADIDDIDDVDDIEEADEAQTEKVPDVAPVSEKRPEPQDEPVHETVQATQEQEPEAEQPAAAPAKPEPEEEEEENEEEDEAPQAKEQDEDEEEEEDEAPAPPARKVTPAAAAPKASATAQPTSAPRRGYLLPLVAIAASIGIVYVATRHGDEPAKTSSSQPAESADGLLAQADRALDEGDTALALQRVGQAEAMAKGPKTLLQRARIEAAVADAAWLHARLVAAPGTPPGPIPAADAARTSANAAAAAAPNDPAAARAKLDALRIAGDLEGARALVPRLAAIGEQSETAYVTAALELAEDVPVSLGAVARLREAVASGHQATRARSALAYALARSGDPVGARHEIDALAAKSSGAPVIADLRAFVARNDHNTKPAVAVVTPPPSAVAAVVPTTPPAPTTVVPPVSPPAPPTPPVAPTTATSAAPAASAAEKGGPATMEAALAAQKSGDLARANTLYKALVAKNPSDIESLTALGEIARKEGRARDAIGYYRRAIGVNSSFFPALLGLADVLWDSGEHAAAQQRYAEITSRFSPGMYPTYVRQRLAADAGAAH